MNEEIHELRNNLSYNPKSKRNLQKMMSLSKSVIKPKNQPNVEETPISNETPKFPKLSSEHNEIIQADFEIELPQFKENESVIHDAVVHIPNNLKLDFEVNRVAANLGDME